MCLSRRELNAWLDELKRALDENYRSKHVETTT